MNRKYFYLLLSAAISVQAFSQKLGGEITYKKYPMWNTYEFSAIIYTAFPSIDNYNSLSINMGDGIEYITPRTDSSILCNNVLKSTYTFLHAYPGNGTYLIFHLDTNIINGIINFPNSSNYPFLLLDTFNLAFFFTIYNSVQFIADPIVKAEVNKIFKYNLTAYDSDGDSLVYYLADLDYTANQYYLPAGFTINSLNGEIIWNKPDTIGTFQFKATIQEWSNVFGGPIFIATTDKMFSILVDTLQSDGQFLGISNWSTNSNGDYESHIAPKTNFSVSLIYQDSLADSVDLFSYSETFLLNNVSAFNTFSSSKQKIGFYSWTPDSSNIRSNPYIVTFRGRSYLDTICHEQDLTLMIYVDTLFSSIAENTFSPQINIYPNPAHSELNIQVTGDGGRGTSEKYTCSIQNILGQTLAEKSFIGNISFDVRTWARGVYFIELKDEKGIRVRTEKVLVE